MKTFKELRDTYPVFKYHRYHIEELEDEIRFTYDFEIVGLAQFHPTWRVSKQHIRYFDKDDAIIQNLVFSIGLVELSSYWKITCSPCVEILAAGLNAEQITWWKKQYYWGLGEFFYTNHIDVSMQDFMHIKSIGESLPINPNKRTHSGNLIPIGGGKDSIVTLALLREQKDNNVCYIINSRGATNASVVQAGYEDARVLRVQRTLDARMLTLNKEGYLNGHTPFSALVAFSATLFAYMQDLRYIVLSNEDSANESTVEGTNINHQYSKSFQFEQDFQDYEKTYIKSEVTYFSLLRGWSELQIAKHFAKLEEFHSVFRSCNVGSKQDVWCCDCPKCLFVYLILYPFLSTKQMITMFGENLLEKESLIDTLEKLIGYQSEKPFECVGSRDEINTAISMRLLRMEKEKETLPLLFKHYQTLPLYDAYKNKKNPYEHYFNEENRIPDSFLNYVKGVE